MVVPIGVKVFAAAVPVFVACIAIYWARLMSHPAVKFVVGDGPIALGVLLAIACAAGALAVFFVEKGLFWKYLYTAASFLGLVMTAVAIVATSPTAQKAMRHQISRFVDDPPTGRGDAARDAYEKDVKDEWDRVVYEYRRGHDMNEFFWTSGLVWVGAIALFVGIDEGYVTVPNL